MPWLVLLRSALFLVLGTGVTGCGTHSVVVTTLHPAAIDLHDANTLAVSVSDLSRASISPALAEALEHHVREEFGRIFNAVTVAELDDDVLRSDPAAVTRSLDADHLLHVAILRHSYAEEVSEAEFRQFEGPVSRKMVRTGKAHAILQISTYRVSDGTVLQGDTLADTYSMQRSAVDREPPPVDTALCFRSLAARVAVTLTALSTPVRSRAVVTFLTNGEFPDIEKGIALVENGEWKKAEALFSAAADAAGEQDGADEIWYDLGLTRQYLQNFRGAEEAYRRALSLRERSRYRRALQALLAVEQEYQEAVDQGVEQ